MWGRREGVSKKANAARGQIWLVRHVIRLINLQFLTSLTECFPLSLSHMDTWDKFKHLCEVSNLKRQVIFFSQRRLDLAFQFPFYRLTQRLNKTDISVSRNGKKCLFLHNLISKPRMNPFRVAEDTNLSHFPRNQLNFKWGMGNTNRPEKPFLSLWSVSCFRTRLPSSFILLSVPRGAKARS